MEDADRQIDALIPKPLAPPDPGASGPVLETFFYAAIGLAISEFGYIERVAAILFAVLVAGDRDGTKVLAAEAAYSTVQWLHGAH